MNAKEIEILIVAVIALFQLYFAGSTFLKIQILRKIFPVVSTFSISKKNTESLMGDANASSLEHSNILCESNNGVLKSILDSINVYLERNKNSVTDFNLIKDIAERNAEAVEEDINLTISIPLYLGLLGTMSGVLIGLFTMSDISEATSGKITDENLGLGISGLLGGVKIAMIASFLGLLLTIVNSGFVLKASKNTLGARKNEFYTFIQTELLPIVNQTLGSTFESLQRNLIRFNSEFTTNLTKLSGIFNANYQALVLQEKILSSLEHLDIAEIAKYNIKVLKELTTSTQEFEKFNIHVQHLTSFVTTSKSLADRINELLARTDNFKTVADKIDSRLTESGALMEFLVQHFKQLDGYKQQFTTSLHQNTTEFNNAVAETSHAMNETFRYLRDHIEKSSAAIQDFTVQEIDALTRALSENKTTLGHLEFLEIISNDVAQFKNSTASQSERVKVQVEELKQGINKSVTILNHIHNNSFSSQARTLVQSMKGVFNGHKK